MKQRKRFLALVSLLLASLITFLFWTASRQYAQARKDHALILAIKRVDTSRALELLDEGASGKARDTGEVPSFGQVLRRYFVHLLHPGTSRAELPKQEPHLSALQLVVEISGSSPDDPDPALIRSLLAHGARIEERDTYGRTPLWYASDFHHRDFVTLLLNLGADVNAHDSEGVTALMRADAPITEILLDHGAQIDAVNQQGKSALIVAACPEGYPDPDPNLDIVRILLEHGANIALRDADGHTAFDFVKNGADTNSRMAAALLKKYGAKE